MGLNRLGFQVPRTTNQTNPRYNWALQNTVCLAGTRTRMRSGHAQSLDPANTAQLSLLKTTKKFQYLSLRAPRQSHSQKKSVWVSTKNKWKSFAFQGLDNVKISLCEDKTENMLQTTTRFLSHTGRKFGKS
jgi:hypothetical protein